MSVGDDRLHRWDREYAELQGINLGFHDGHLPAPAALLLDAIVPATEPTVLDIGCGKGRIGLHLALSGCRMTGLDGSPAALESFRSDARRLGVESRIDLHEADLFGPWPVPDAAFHHAVAVTVLDNALDDHSAAHFAGELARVVRPGGFAVIEDYTPNDGYYGPLAADMPDTGQCIVTDPHNGIMFRLWTPAEIVNILTGWTLIRGNFRIFESDKYGAVHPRESWLGLFRHDARVKHLCKT